MGVLDGLFRIVPADETGADPAPEGAADPAPEEVTDPTPEEGVTSQNFENTEQASTQGNSPEDATPFDFVGEFNRVNSEIAALHRKLDTFISHGNPMQQQSGTASSMVNSPQSIEIGALEELDFVNRDGKF